MPHTRVFPGNRGLADDEVAGETGALAELQRDGNAVDREIIQRHYAEVQVQKRFPWCFLPAVFSKDADTGLLQPQGYLRLQRCS